MHVKNEYKACLNQTGNMLIQIALFNTFYLVLHLFSKKYVSLTFVKTMIHFLNNNFHHYNNNRTNNEGMLFLICLKVCLFSSATLYF